MNKIFEIEAEIIPNAIRFQAQDLINKIFEIEAEIAGVASSYAQNRQRRYQEFYVKDWTAIYLLLVL